MHVREFTRLRQEKTLIVEEFDRLLETPERFLRWLMSKSPEDTVGISTNPWNCPIHCFLKESTGEPRFLVSANKISTTLTVTHGDSIWSRVGPFTIPSEWATKFIEMVDELQLTETEKVEISRNKALEILGSIIPEYDVALTETREEVLA